MLLLPSDTLPYLVKLYYIFFDWLYPESGCPYKTRVNFSLKVTTTAKLCKECFTILCFKEYEY